PGDEKAGGAAAAPRPCTPVGAVCGSRTGRWLSPWWPTTSSRAGRRRRDPRPVGGPSLGGKGPTGRLFIRVRAPFHGRHHSPVAANGIVHGVGQEKGSGSPTEARVRPRRGARGDDAVRGEAAGGAGEPARAPGGGD